MKFELINRVRWMTILFLRETEVKRTIGAVDKQNYATIPESRKDEIHLPRLDSALYILLKVTAAIVEYSAIVQIRNTVFGIMVA